ncbi:MAG TPA: hypothetical protein VHP33_25405 [Polyangiaceae bacterium]|nr:hypothetical protein [Polyangiaceae bacterium]
MAQRRSASSLAAVGAASRPARSVRVVELARRRQPTEPVPVGEELERFMTELGRLVADLWFEGKFDARLAPEDISKSDD